MGEGLFGLGRRPNSRGLNGLEVWPDDLEALVTQFLETRAAPAGSTRSDDPGRR
jgi:hypothetical protein